MMFLYILLVLLLIATITNYLPSCDSFTVTTTVRPSYVLLQKSSSLSSSSSSNIESNRRSIVTSTIICATATTNTIIIDHDEVLIPTTTVPQQEPSNSSRQEECVPNNKLLIHWKGEGVEGYSIQFRQLEFIGALSAVLGDDNMTITDLSRDIQFVDALNYTGSADMPPAKLLRYNQAMQYVTILSPRLSSTLIKRKVLTEAIQRCSLIHALYEVVAEGNDYESVSTNALQQSNGFNDMSKGNENEEATWCMRVRNYDNTHHLLSNNLSKQKRYGRRTRSITKEREALSALKPLLLQFGGGVDLESPDVKIYLFEGLAAAATTTKTKITLARRMAVGARVFIIAPNTRICQTNTPLCPIAAFTMCNVAGVRGNHTTILDPYCGSAAILLAAAMNEPNCKTVGIEIAHDGLVNRDDIRLDFTTRNLTEPVALLRGDSTSEDARQQARSVIGNEPFDYLITDPPYGIRESNLDTKMPILELVRYIASDRKAGRPILKRGGKLVCFVPCQSDETVDDVMPTAEMLEDAGLQLEVARAQPLNSNLCRWLVSFVCVR